MLLLITKWNSVILHREFKAYYNMFPSESDHSSQRVMYNMIHVTSAIHIAWECYSHGTGNVIPVMPDMIVKVIEDKKINIVDTYMVFHGN